MEVMIDIKYTYKNFIEDNNLPDNDESIDLYNEWLEKEIEKRKARPFLF